MLYSDEIKKIEYYKQRIIDRYLNQGQIIDKLKLQSYIDTIDTKLSVFRQGFIENGEVLDLDKFNQQKAALYQDLKILYELIFELANERLTTTEAYIKCSMAELNELAKKYQYKTALESLSIYGNTIYYKTNGFIQYYNGGRVYIELGPVSIPSGSIIACLLDSNECDHKDVTFKFDDNTQIADYLNNKSYLFIEGNYKINTYDIKSEINYSESFKIPVETEIKENTQYNLLAGEDYVKIKYFDTGEIEYIKKTLNIPVTIDRDAEISFYTYNATYLELDMNKVPEYKNFEGNNIISPKQRQKVLLKVNSGFTFDLATDGRLFADISSCIINNQELYSSVNYPNIDSYTVEEIEYGDPVNFSNVQVIVNNADTTFYDINYIAIKQAQTIDINRGNG